MRPSVDPRQKWKRPRLMGQRTQPTATRHVCGATPALKRTAPAGMRHALLRTLMEDYWRQRHRDGGYAFVGTPHIGRAALWETSGHLQWYQDGMYAAIDIGRAILSQTDELPVPYADRQEPRPQLSRPPAPLRRARHGVPLRALAHLAGTAARARLYPGRRAPVLPPRPDGDRDRAGLAVLPVGPGRLRLSAAGDGAERA